MSKTKLGFDVPSGDLVRDLSSGKRVHLRRGQNARVRKSDEGSRAIEFVCATDGVKRDNNRLRNDGWDIGSFAKNPVMLWAHDYNHPPVGSWRDWRIEDDEDGNPALAMTAVFAEYEFANTVYDLYTAGHMRAVSIGWTPLEYEEMLDDEGRVVGFDFIRNELLECSAVPIPADPDALMKATSRGIITPDDVGMFAQATRLGEVSRDVAYVLDHREKRQDEEGAQVAITLNEKAVEWAKGTIESGEHEAEMDWEFTEEDAKYLLGEDEDWEAYSHYFLGRNEDHTEDSHEGWVYPIAKRKPDGEVCVYGKALTVAAVEAEEAGLPEIAEAAAMLSEFLTSVIAEGGDVEEEVVVDEEVVEEGVEIEEREHEEGHDEMTVELEEKLRNVADAIEEMREMLIKYSPDKGGEGEGGGAPENEEDPPLSMGLTKREADRVVDRAEQLLDGLRGFASKNLRGPDDSSAAEGELITSLSTLEAMLSDSGEQRIGKKVSKARTSKLGEVRGYIYRAVEVLDEVLEEIEEMAEEVEEEEVVSTEEVMSDEAVVEEAGRAAPSIESRIAKLTASLDGTDSEKTQKVTDALKSLAERLGVDLDKTYMDDLI